MDDFPDTDRDDPFRDDSRNRSHVKIPGGAVHTQLGGVAGLARDGATTLGCTTVRAHAEHAQM